MDIQKTQFGEGDGPAWIPTQSGGTPCKPVIRCNCGKHIVLRLHHVHSDGSVTASFHHATASELQHDGDGYFFMHNGKRYSTEPGCGWHVHLKLLDWTEQDFPGEE